MIQSLLSYGIGLAESGRLPDWVLRRSIRSLCRKRLRELKQGTPEQREERARDFVDRLKQSAVAHEPEVANEQHYEVPAQFFEWCLGDHLKYSSCFFADGVTDLSDAELAALKISTQRAGIADGMRVLELGCGWGSLSLHMARSFPGAQILGVSNSASQRQYILNRAESEGLQNLRIETCDVNTFESREVFDRVVSIEMFEHMRNYEALLARVAGWLEDDGRLFVHVFCHREASYLFEDRGPSDWMARHFFTAGLMPSQDLLPSFDEHLVEEERWIWDGQHYGKTAEAWLKRLDAHREQVLQLFADTYGPRDAVKWLNRWRLFYLACAELFAFDGGQEWQVVHHRFRKRS